MDNVAVPNECGRESVLDVSELGGNAGKEGRERS